MPSILITGVSTGIGRACANLSAQSGYEVIGTVRDASRRPDALHTDVRLESLDLSVPGNAAALAERVLNESGCPDVLLNNAGTARFGALEEISADELAAIYQVNVFGQLELIRGLAPAFRQRGSGVIANVTSLGGTMTFPFFGAYNSTKWALEGASEGLWHELKPFGVRVKAIEPGFVETAIWEKALGEAPSAERVAGADDPYGRYKDAMREFERSIKSRTTAEDSAREVLRAIEDPSDRLRYPVSAYARPLAFARRVFGAQATMGFFHRRWMGR